MSEIHFLLRVSSLNQLTLLFSISGHYLHGGDLYII